MLLRSPCLAPGVVRWAVGAPAKPRRHSRVLAKSAAACCSSQSQRATVSRSSVGHDGRGLLLQPTAEAAGAGGTAPAAAGALHAAAPAGAATADSAYHKPSNPLTKALNTVLGKLGVQLSDRAGALVLLNMIIFIFSTNWVVVKESGAAFDPFAFAFMRFLVAAGALSPFLKAAAEDSRVLRAGAEVGLWCSAGYLLQSQGLLATGASRASFLATFTVIVVPILSGLSGRGVRALTWASVLGALGGMALLEGSGAPPSLGDVWSFLSACAFGVQVFRTEHWSRSLGSRRALPLMSVVLATTCTCALAATVATHPATALGVLRDPGLVLQAAAGGALPWQAALYTGLLSTALCLVIEVFVLRDVTATEAAICYSLEPVLGATLAFLVLGETWGPAGWAGAALILASSLATQLCGGEEGEPLAQSDAE